MQRLKANGFSPIFGEIKDSSCKFSAKVDIFQEQSSKSTVVLVIFTEPKHKMSNTLLQNKWAISKLAISYSLPVFQFILRKIELH